MRNKPIIHKLLALIICCFCLSFTGFADRLADDGIVVKSTNYLLDKNSGKMVKSGNSIMYISADKILIRQTSDNKEEPSVLFDATKNELIIFLNSKEYMVVDEAQMKIIKQQLKSMYDMMEKMKANMSDEQKKLMEKNLPGDDKPLNATFTANGRSTVNGWASEKFTAKVNGELVSDIYIASYGAIGATKGDFAAMQKMMIFFRTHLSGLGRQFKMQSDASFMALGGDNPAFTKGVPVKISTYDKNLKTGDTIIDSIDKKTLSGDLFKIPSQMIKKDLTELFQSGMNR